MAASRISRCRLSELRSVGSGGFIAVTTKSNSSSNAALDTGAFTLRASDRADTTSEVQTRIELIISGTDESELSGIFEGLSEGGIVKAPLEKMSWGDIFGALVDKFGIGWQVNIAGN
jgi:PhnB protein